MLTYVSDVRDYGVDFRVRLIKLLICDSTKVQASLVTVKEKKEIKNEEIKNLEKIEEAIEKELSAEDKAKKKKIGT